MGTARALSGNRASLSGNALTTRTGRVGQHTPNLRNPPDFDTRPAARRAGLIHAGRSGAESHLDRVPLRPSGAEGATRALCPSIVLLQTPLRMSHCRRPPGTTASRGDYAARAAAPTRQLRGARTVLTVVVGRSDDFVGEDCCSRPRRRGTGSTDRSEIARRELAPLAPTNAAIARRRNTHGTGLRTERRESERRD